MCGLQINATQATLIVDNDKASSLGISAKQLRSTLYSGFGSRQSSTRPATASLWLWSSRTRSAGHGGVVGASRNETCQCWDYVRFFFHPADESACP